MTQAKYEPDPVKERALDVLFILHADHEQNCGTNAMRAIGSSMVDPYSAMAGAAAALYGPLHGGANEEVLRMLTEIGHVKNVPAYIETREEGRRPLMGFGHRVYKNYDPRAKIIKRTADEVFKVTGVNPLLEIALELERIALQDEYFVSRKLYPNVDFYSGIIYQAMGFPVEILPGAVRHSAHRRAGWRSGSNWSTIPIRRSRAHGRSIWATISATTCRWINDNSIPASHCTRMMSRRLSRPGACLSLGGEPSFDYATGARCT